MNLRKDHCRDPDEDDRERVNETPPGRDSPRPGIVPPRRASPGAARTIDIPRRGGRQGTLTSGAEAPRRAREAIRADDNRNRTTLGNGYLGSRIDEERSEMRYLV